jgi:hypothetical protein
MASAVREPLTPPTGAAETPAATGRDDLRRIRLSPQIWLGVAAIWCWLLNRSASPFTPGAMLVLTPVFLVAAWLLYRGFRCEIALGRRDLAVFAGFLALQVAVRRESLFHSLAGDELYHAERASLLLNGLRAWVEALPPRSIDEVRASMWNAFDPRHLAVAELWRAVSFPLLLAAALLVAVLGAARARGRRWMAWAIIVVAVALVSTAAPFAPPVDPHPPLNRLPLFLGELLFGLNSFAFRIPGLLEISALSLAVFRLLEAHDPLRRPALLWHLAVAGVIGFIPVVFYAAEAVEPSIHGFVACTAVLLLCWEFVQGGDSTRLVLAGVAAGLGMVARQPLVFAWALIVPLALLSRERKGLLSQVRVFFPALLAIPYFFTVHALGHTATSVSEGTALEKIARSLWSGVGPISILNTATLPWAVATALLLLGVCLPRLRWVERALYLLFLPAYAIFHVIWSYLWPVGRYQAEYVAPFQALTIFLSARLLGPAARRIALPFVAILAGITLEVSANLAWDTSYAEWPKMRITTSASFPYRQGLGFLKMREAGGSFALLGGQPWYGDMALWLSGHTFAETRAWREHQEAVSAWVASSATKSLPDLVGLCRRRGIRYLVLQSGTRREMQHRTAAMQAAIDLVEAAGRGPASGISRIAQFGPENGGSLEIYLVL